MTDGFFEAHEEDWVHSPHSVRFRWEDYVYWVENGGTHWTKQGPKRLYYSGPKGPLLVGSFPIRIEAAFPNMPAVYLN